MYIKKYLSAIGISILIMLFLLFVFYHFNITWMNLSNVFFFVGLMYFFPGLMMVTGASNVFNGVTFLTKRMFTKRKNLDKYATTFNEYLVNKNEVEKVMGRGIPIMVIGGIYIAGSFVLNVLV